MAQRTDPHIVVKAALREGYPAEVRDGHAYFPEKVWHIDIAALIAKYKLNIAWRQDGKYASVWNSAEPESRFNTYLGETLEEAVLSYVALRPKEAIEDRG